MVSAAADLTWVAPSDCGERAEDLPSGRRARPAGRRPPSRCRRDAGRLRLPLPPRALRDGRDRDRQGRTEHRRPPACDERVHALLRLPVRARGAAAPAAGGRVPARGDGERPEGLRADACAAADVHARSRRLWRIRDRHTADRVQLGGGAGARGISPRPDAAERRACLRFAPRGAERRVNRDRHVAGSGRRVPARRRRAREDRARPRRGRLAPAVLPPRDADLGDDHAREEGPQGPAPARTAALPLDLPDRALAPAGGGLLLVRQHPARADARAAPGLAERGRRNGRGSAADDRVRAVRARSAARARRFVAAGAKAGSVRLDPATFKVAGHMLRHDPEAQLWRVQHL